METAAQKFQALLDSDARAKAKELVDLVESCISPVCTQFLSTSKGGAPAIVIVCTEEDATEILMQALDQVMGNYGEDGVQMPGDYPPPKVTLH